MSNYIYKFIGTSFLSLLLACGTISVSNVYASGLSNMITGVNTGIENTKQSTKNTPTQSSNSLGDSMGSILSRMNNSGNSGSSGSSMPSVNPNNSNSSSGFSPSSHSSQGSSYSAVVPAGSSINMRDLQAIIASVPRGKILLVNFYASWCPPCVQELPHLVSVRKKFSKNDVIMIGINLDKSKAEMDRFNSRMGLNYDTYHDAQGNILGQLYKANSVPFNALYDKTGELVFAESGFVDEDFVTELFGIALE